LFQSSSRLGYVSADTNLRRYCGDSPTDLTDPTGLGAVKFGKFDVTLNAVQQAIYDGANSQLAAEFPKTSPEYLLRSNIVLAALVSGIHYGDDRFDTRFWNPKQHTVLTGRSPAWAVLDVWARGNREIWDQFQPIQVTKEDKFQPHSGYRTGCKVACGLVFLMGETLTSYQLDLREGRTAPMQSFPFAPYQSGLYLGKLDALVGTKSIGTLFGTASTPLQAFASNPNGFTLAQLTPGDRIWVQNPAKNPPIGLEGANRIYVGRAKGVKGVPDGTPIFVGYSGKSIWYGLDKLYASCAWEFNLPKGTELKITRRYQPVFPFPVN
jgi:hypothetical protein